MAFEISVFLKNKITHFEEITRNLRKENINIRCLTLNNINHGWGVLNLLVDKPEKAYRLLADSGSSVVMREVIPLGMKDEAGGLDELLIKLSRTGIHIESAYTRLIDNNKTAILILEVMDVLEATQRLVKNDIQIIDDKIVYGE